MAKRVQAYLNLQAHLTYNSAAILRGVDTSKNNERDRMSLYQDYLKEIEVRKADLGLNPKPIDSAELLSEIIAQIKDTGNAEREASLNFFIYNTLPGTTPAAGVKAAFLKDIVTGAETVAEISPEFAVSCSYQNYALLYACL